MTRQDFLLIGGGVTLLLIIVGGIVWLRTRATDEEIEPTTSGQKSDTVINISEVRVADLQAELAKTPADKDGDGLSDEKEGEIGTNPNKSDTDGDGFSDLEEVQVLKTDPSVKTENPRVKASEELRDEVLTEAVSPYSFLQSSTSPQRTVGDQDSDKDGLSDNQELQLGTDPNRTDTDSDGLGDSEEVVKYKTNPKNPDSDGDGFKDGAEVSNGYNPLGK